MLLQTTWGPVLKAENDDKLQQNILYWLETELIKRKTLINTSKTKAIVTGKEDKKINIKISGTNRTSRKF